MKVVLEFLDRGSLTEVLDQFHKECLSEPEIAYVCREVNINHKVIRMSANTI